jgi:hypothetical protein
MNDFCRESRRISSSQDFFPEEIGSEKHKVKVKQSHYTPWKRLGGEEV